MKKSIDNDIFFEKVLKRKITRGIAYHCCIMDNLAKSIKVDFVIRRINEVPFKEGRLILLYWEETDKLIDLFKEYNIHSYNIIREYKINHVKPGYISMNIDSFFINSKFFKVLLKRHFGYDFSENNSLGLWPNIVIDTGKDEIVLFHLYDDRGFYEYFIRK